MIQVNWIKEEKLSLFLGKVSAIPLDPKRFPHTESEFEQYITILIHFPIYLDLYLKSKQEFK